LLIILIIRENVINFERFGRGEVIAVKKKLEKRKTDCTFCLSTEISLTDFRLFQPPIEKYDVFDRIEVSRFYSGNVPEKANNENLQIPKFQSSLNPPKILIMGSELVCVLNLTHLEKKRIFLKTACWEIYFEACYKGSAVKIYERYATDQTKSGKYRKY